MDFHQLWCEYKTIQSINTYFKDKWPRNGFAGLFLMSNEHSKIFIVRSAFFIKKPGLRYSTVARASKLRN